MKLALASDLHLEFGDIELHNTESADVLILSGDILIAEDLHDCPEVTVNTEVLSNKQVRAQRFRNFLRRCADRFPHVIYIAGNHEFYHGKFPGSLQDLRNECARFSNLYFIENDCLTIDDVTFVGCTLWTDMNKGDPTTQHAVANMMNDYRLIRHNDLGYTKLRPAHTAEQHRRSVQYIQTVIEENFDRKCVVVGHMAPSFLSIHEQYKNNKDINGAYASDLSEFILDHPQVKLWTHGHTHHNFDYMIGTCRIICNPRGYIGYEPCAENFQLKFIEI